MHSIDAFFCFSVDRVLTKFIKHAKVYGYFKMLLIC